MTACVLLFDTVSTADATSIAFGIGAVYFMVMFFLLLWFDTRHENKRWELRDLIYKEDRELRDMVYKETRELRDMVWKTERELKDQIRDTERRLRDALDDLREELKSDPEHESLDAQWATLLAESRERAERARERLKRRNQPPPDDIDEGLKRLEQTIANMTPSDNEALQRADASLKRILENLKRTREIQRGREAPLEGE